MNDWKINKGGKTYLKVIDFPSWAGSLGGESMWVRVLEGDDYNGVGMIANDPTQSDLKYGDKISYGGGTDEKKPRYTGLISKSASRLMLKKHRHMLLHVELSDEQLERLGCDELKDIIRDVPADKIFAITGEAELNRCLIERGEAANVWSVDDFECVAENMESSQQATEDIYDRTKFREALQDMISNMNPDVGISWDVIDVYLDDHCRKDV